MSKLIVSEIESTGSSVQINDDLKVGSTGTNVITSGNVVAPSEDMIKNFKAFENPITVYDAAVSSTGVPGFTNAVPYVTSTSTGLTSTTALAATSTGNSLLTNFSADAVYVYNSSGTANCKNDYWGATIDIPKAFRGQNIVLSFDYRTEAASTNVTAADQWFVAVQDKTNTVAFLVTATALVSAGNAVGVVSSTGLAVGDKVWLEGGGNAQGDVSNSITEAYITEVTDSTNIKLSADYTPASTANSIGQTGFLTNTLQFLAAADSDTDKVGKNRKLSFKTADDTAQVNVFFQLRNTSSTVVHSLYFDNVYISSNMFLQASSQLPQIVYAADQPATNSYADNTGMLGLSTALMTGGAMEFGSQAEFDKFMTISGSPTKFEVHKDCIINFYFSGHTATANRFLSLYKNTTTISADGYFVGGATPDHSSTTFGQIDTTFKFKAGDYFALAIGDMGGTSTDTMSSTSQRCQLRIRIEPTQSDVILLESQDEIFTDWVEWTPTGTHTTNTSYSGKWRRNGPDMEVRIQIYYSGDPNATVLEVDCVPSGYSVNEASLPSAYGTSNTYPDMGRAIFYDAPGSTPWGQPVRISYNGTGSNRIKFWALATNATTWGYYEPSNSNSGHPFTFASGDYVWASFSVPIQGWNANFNPLLSLPLVEIGANVEEYQVAGGGADGGTKSFRPYFDSTSTYYSLNKNTISTLGTVDNSSTMGWSFTASQRVKVHLAASIGNNSGSGLWSIVKTPNAPSTYADNANSDAIWNGFRLTNNTPTVAGASINGAVSFIMEPGEYVQIVRNFTGIETVAYQTSLALMVEKDFSNTNMAHIIKPAVAYVKDKKAYNDTGGAGTTGSWQTRDLNTVTGESWFVTLNSTNNGFTLDPGTYEITTQQSFRDDGYMLSRLYDQTNSVAVPDIYVNQQNASDVVVQPVAHGNITVTSATEYRLQYWITNSGGSWALGAPQDSTQSTAGQGTVFSQVKIRKLK